MRKNHATLISKPIHVHLDFYQRDQPERFALGLFENRMNSRRLLRVKKDSIAFFYIRDAFRERVHTHRFPNIQFPKN